MIWIVLVLGLLCVAMSCVALWYRAQWDKSLDRECDLSEKYEEMKEKYNYERDERKRLSNSISALNIEVDATKEKLQKSEFQCDLLRKESDDKSTRIVALLDENNKLRQHLPKRDSKGRFCKR